MKLASLQGGRDGRLVVVSRDLRRAVLADKVAPTMRHAIDHWAVAEPGLRALARQLDDGQLADAFDFDPSQALAPLPRSHQFVDASAFLNHGELMVKAYKLDQKHDPATPIFVPRQGDDFRGPVGDYEFPSEADQCDFEGEFAVITDDIPMGATPGQALDRVRLVTMLNDVSMRAHLFTELGMGFGLLRSKTATVFAPVAVTPDELGDAWKDGRVHLDLHVSRNGEWFGHPNGREMDFGFGELLSYLAYNRRLGAGMVLGSGTVSNRGYRQVGSACLSEQRAIEVMDGGAPRTAFLAYGERLRMEAKDAAGQSVFGAIESHFVASAPAA